MTNQDKTPAFDVEALIAAYDREGLPLMVTRSIGLDGEVEVEGVYSGVPRGRDEASEAIRLNYDLAQLDGGDRLLFDRLCELGRVADHDKRVAP